MSQRPEERDELSNPPPPAGEPKEQQQVEDDIEETKEEIETKETTGVSSDKTDVDDVEKPKPNPTANQQLQRQSSDGGGVSGGTVDGGAGSSNNASADKSTPPSSAVSSAAPAAPAPSPNPKLPASTSAPSTPAAPIPVRHVLPQIPTMFHSRLAVSKASRKVQTNSTFLLFTDTSKVATPSETNSHQGLTKKNIWVILIYYPETY